MADRKRQRPENKKQVIHDYKHLNRKKAIEMAEIVETEVKGKKLVHHPIMPKTYIYV